MRYSNPVPQFSDSDGKPIVGGKLYFYQTGTTTLKTIYSDSSFTIPQNNPVITDSNGDFEDIFLDGLYNAVLKDDSGVQRWGPKAVGKINRDILTADAGGTADAITAVFDPVKKALTNEETVIVRASAANATTTPNFSPDGLTAKTITKNGNQALAIGDIFGLDHSLILQYNSSNDVWELLNPAIQSVSASQLEPGQYGGAYVKLVDSKATTVDGGASIAGTQTRDLNTEVTDTGNHCTLSSNQFTLDEGTWYIKASAPAFSVGRNKLFLYNISDSQNEPNITSTSANVSSAVSAQTTASLMGEFIISASKTFRIDHYTTVVKAINGLGVATLDGTTEIYTVVELWKIK
jgi:hypothetical protein